MEGEEGNRVEEEKGGILYSAKDEKERDALDVTRGDGPLESRR